MSLGREYIEEMEFETALKYKKVEQQAEKGIWETKDGQKIPVEKMSTSHIENTINLLRRRNVCDLWSPWISRLEQELNKRRILLGGQ